MPDFGEAVTARQVGQVRRSHDLISAARRVLGHTGMERVLALLQAADPLPGRTVMVGVPVRTGTGMSQANRSMWRGP